MGIRGRKQGVITESQAQAQHRIAEAETALECAQEELSKAIDAARDIGLTWGGIGAALGGLSASQAHTKYGPRSKWRIG